MSLPFGSLASLQAFRGGLQTALEAQYPGTIQINGQNYPVAVVPRTGGLVLLEGGQRSQYSAVFLVLKTRMPLAEVREETKDGQPLKPVRVTHLETGLTYTLRNEWSDANSVNRRLECEQEE